MISRATTESRLSKVTRCGAGDSGLIRATSRQAILKQTPSVGTQSKQLPRIHMHKTQTTTVKQPYRKEETTTGTESPQAACRSSRSSRSSRSLGHHIGGSCITVPPPTLPYPPQVHNVMYTKYSEGASQLIVTFLIHSNHIPHSHSRSQAD